LQASKRPSSCFGLTEAEISDPLSYEGPFSDELRTIADIVKRAGAIPLRYHGSDIDVERKEGDEPVTLADRECSEFLVAEVTQAFPDDIVISEEAADDLRRLDAERVWYIDPIDGTKSFIAGGTGYCVMVGLTIKHRPVLGVLYQPNHHTLLYACKGGGAWVQKADGEPTRLHCSEMSDPGQARLLSKRGGDRAAIHNAFGFREDEALGSIGLKLAAMALGACELYVNPATNCSSWDTCGPEILLEEAGGKLTNMHGEQVRYDNTSTRLQEGLVASSGPMHEFFLARLATVFTKALGSES
jgi:3'(2'), 5'-bisphosphate nucleotidase